MTTGITIRPVRPGEETAVSTLITSVFKTTFGRSASAPTQLLFCENDSAVAIKKRIADGAEIFVADKDNSIIGVLELAHKTHIARLYVHTDHQRQGVARALLGHVVAARPGVTAFTANASAYARQAYEALGFRPDGEPFHFYGELDAVPMVLTGLRCGAP